MKKTAQSLLDFINVMPLQSVQNAKNATTSKEIKALYEIWNNKTDDNGSFMVPTELDPLIIASLSTKQMIKNKPLGRLGANSSITRTVEITDKGRSIIRNLILATDKSAFENEANYNKRLSTNHKFASKQEPNPINWLNKVFSKWNLH